MVPNMLTFANKNVEKLRKFRIDRVFWSGSYTVGISLNDGQRCDAGAKLGYTQVHIFDPTKKITKVECII